MSTDCQKTTAKAIPSTKRVTISDAEHMPHDYSTTPGGTLFSTTPGGTRIIYDRKFLLGCRSSPVAKTPPRGLPDIPGVTSPPSKDTIEKARKGELLNNNNNITAPDSNDTGEDAQFEMDI
ncbi:eukaryotic translation initiation factor 4E-binding protein 1-like [Thunnus albacares]|uniref:eukaryotic translation initiation factor 4E-binding protein 1-like n=1 Tax=Thunnus maccoyii TaxID=8240 RepID=UPI001C4AFA44|nr:eukaryotic translation initiation factor 4E-binding protein 1-like [Thunnus maccoyii]XP_042277325.1 eukaryotic translation initiation factor 4E-binding protein 1-like [Thunnus maccoyii]XP_044227915.1 eukaryotic translation initiation factor 4E-binding protein 1-like [Thunnus albacares]XP_044227924.1 eukaryotic translation initiation factor 4E-binding protein 1-like [Thunnus albacares]|eukprot:superscaffoldBa00000379_g4246